MATRQEAEERVELGFWVHLTAYLAVVGGLAILNYSRNPDNLWVLWVAGGWGIGIVAHAMAFFTAESRQRMIERTDDRLDRREARRERRETDDNARNMTDRMSEASR
jgi:hypothetical protein